MKKIDVTREIRELKTHLSYSKNIGFFFGAGTSCALGLPNITGLTDDVEKALKGGAAKTFSAIKKDLEPTIVNRKVNIEDILNQLRQIRELTKESKSKSYEGVCGEDAKAVDTDICREIYRIISEKEGKANLSLTNRFFAWYNLLNRDFSKEVFTTNYDLIIEKSLELSQIPYFDGFVGAYEPFFWQESVDYSVTHEDLTKNWVRLWKLHGSLSWFWRQDKENRVNRIVRLGHVGDDKCIKNELVIYPSREKYDSSRKQPFVAYFDRMRDYLSSGELLFVISGYSFSDQHINEIIFNCLRQNNRLFVLVFCYLDAEVEAVGKMSSAYLNLNVFGPKKAIINGELCEWEFNKGLLKPGENAGLYWDETKKTLILGDFSGLVDFLVKSSGRQESEGVTQK